MENKQLMNKTNSFFVVLVVIALVVFFLVTNYSGQEKQVEQNNQFVEPYRAVLEGVYVCLPYKEEGDSSPLDPECEPGIKIDTGEYYAVNFFLMSKMSAPLSLGQRFSANGVITTNEVVDSKFELKGVFSVTDSLTLLAQDEKTSACDRDMKLCSDGSYVGREGSGCQFTVCSIAPTFPSETTVSLNGSGVVGNITISPQEVVVDSRCPAGVECIWAGTVEVRTVLATEVAQGEHIITLGEPQVFGEYVVTLIEVTPKKTEEVIADAVYEFTYLVDLR